MGNHTVSEVAFSYRVEDNACSDAFTTVFGDFAPVLHAFDGSAPSRWAQGVAVISMLPIVSMLKTNRSPAAIGSVWTTLPVITT